MKKITIEQILNQVKNNRKKTIEKLIQQGINTIPKIAIELKTNPSTITKQIQKLIQEKKVIKKQTPEKIIIYDGNNYPLTNSEGYVITKKNKTKYYYELTKKK